MKQSHHLKALSVCCIIAIAMLFVGCDSGDDPYLVNQTTTILPPSSNSSDDNNQLSTLASVLRGHWTGAMRYEYTAENGQRSIAQFNTNIEFDQLDATKLSGRGKEVDTATNSNGEQESQTLLFSWNIDQQTGDIIITYDDTTKRYRITFSSNSDTQSYLDSERFRGTMIGVNNDEFIDFDMRRYTYTTIQNAQFTRTISTRANSIVPENKLVRR